MSLAETIKVALEKIQYIAKTETVIGEPITAGDVTLIPVSRVSIGFAAGGGGNEGKSGSGAGTGGGVSVSPLAFIAVTGDKVQVYPISKTDPGLQKILAMAPDLIQKAAKYFGKKEGKEGEKKDRSRNKDNGNQE